MRSLEWLCLVCVRQGREGGTGKEGCGQRASGCSKWVSGSPATYLLSSRQERDGGGAKAVRIRGSEVVPTSSQFKLRSSSC